MPSSPYQALLLVSFGGPEAPAEVMPFLRRVTVGRGVPESRLALVAEHYLARGGRSPINDQNRELLAALRAALPVPVFWGNRNAAPFVTDAVAEMAAAGVTRALAYVTSAFGSYSGCRQYREDIATACAEVGPGAPAIDKLRTFYNHPAFIACFTDATRAALAELPGNAPAQLVFTAHSVPTSMGDTSPYLPQLRAAAGLVAAAVGVSDWTLAWQSRSGPPQVPWLEPDVSAVLGELAAAGEREVVVVPLGFVSDHMEVVHDLDTVAIPAAAEAGLQVRRAATPGSDPRLVAMVADLIAERQGAAQRCWLGDRGPAHDTCPRDCCPAPGRPAGTSSGQRDPAGSVSERPTAR